MQMLAGRHCSSAVRCSTPLLGCLPRVPPPRARQNIHHRSTVGVAHSRPSTSAPQRVQPCISQSNIGSQGPSSSPHLNNGTTPRRSQQQLQQLDTNVWAYKPAWCQPWSILGTGTAVVSGVWAVSGGSPAWTALGALPVAAWWYLFLIIYPQQFRDYAKGVNEQQKALAQQQAWSQQQQQQQQEEQQ